MGLASQMASVYGDGCERLRFKGHVGLQNVVSAQGVGDAVAAVARRGFPPSIPKRMGYDSSLPIQPAGCPDGSSADATSVPGFAINRYRYPRRASGVQMILVKGRAPYIQSERFRCAVSPFRPIAGCASGSRFLTPLCHAPCRHV